MSPPLLCKLRKHFFSHLTGEKEKQYMKKFCFFFKSFKEAFDGSLTLCVTILVECAFAMSKSSAEHCCLAVLEVCKYFLLESTLDSQ